MSGQPEAIPSPMYKAFALSIPVLMVYFPLGLVFGVVFVHSGFNWIFAPIMSAFVYAGAVQFVTLSMMTEHASILAILLTTTFVGLRNSFYGLSLLERFKCSWLIKIFLIFGLVDANYAIMLTYTHPKEDLKFCIYITFFVYSYLVLGTLTGALFADHLPKVEGLEFILTCFFMVLVIDYFMLHRKIKPILIPIILSVLAYAILPQYYLLIAITLTVIYLYLSQKELTHG